MINLKVIIPKYFPKVMYLLLIPVYLNDWWRYVSYSGVTGLNSKEKMLGRIVADYHVIEKGLTMPETRLGFGKSKLFNLIAYCYDFIDTYGCCDDQVGHAISTIFEYKQFHEEHGYALDRDLLEKIDVLSNKFENIPSSHQKVLTRDEYFNSSFENFKEFSNSRRSIRNYSNKEVPMEKIYSAIELARNAPSVCNRQSVRVYVYSDKEVVQKLLKTQAGNRGFGHLANKVIVVTAELGAMHALFERNQAFVDGGIWAMNLLYALHYYKIAACPLNCSNSFKKDKLLRKYGDIKDSESLIMLISIGDTPDSFKIASSPRKKVEEISTFL
ncbi:nitroreductase family protein [Ochrovirga pacifica]|uniref:nitroreductase family protein n=1 Tax=Ochrovirga pacifica TaxID=1042376 RepID=UPI000255A071|nr:nitroreductase family protein [Ochrovirga pacifica]